MRWAPTFFLVLFAMTAVMTVLGPLSQVTHVELAAIMCLLLAIFFRIK